MNRNEFEKFYINYGSQSIAQPEIEIGNRLRIDWDAFDHSRTSADSDKMISKKEALQDVAHLFLLLKYAYSGFEYYSLSTDFEELENLLIQKLKNDPDPNVSSIDLCKFLHRELSPKINDGHVWVEYADFEGKFLMSRLPYVTDIVVKRRSEQFIVVKGDGCLKSGVSLRSEDIRGELFPTLIPDHDEECYLIGCYAIKDPGSIEVAGLNYETHMLKCCKARLWVKGLYSLEEESKYAVFGNPTYQIYEDSALHEQNFIDAGRMCASKDNV